MFSIELWIGALLVILLVLSTTANVAIRHVPRVLLAERFEKRGKLNLLSRLHEHRYELLFNTSLVRISSILGLTLLIAHMFGARPIPPTEPALQYTLIFVASVVVIMTVGVAIPNAWAHYGGDAFLAAAVPVMLFLRPVFYPFAGLHYLFDVLVRRLAGVPGMNGLQDEAEQIEKAILGVVSEGELTGAVQEEHAELIESVMAFRDTHVSEIMTPRTEIVAIPGTVGLEEAKDTINREGHSRIPVYGENIDDIKGVLYAKDLLKIDDNQPFDPTAVMRKVPFVPESKPIADLLQELRDQKVHLAIVLDEYGGTAGLVTIEDILEELVGEIADEYEVPEPDPILRIDDHTLEVDARVHIDELNEELNVELPEDQEYDTIGGFVFSTLGKIPSAGEELEYENVRLRVIDAEERKINRLRVEVLPDKAPA